MQSKMTKNGFRLLAILILFGSAASGDGFPVPEPIDLSKEVTSLSLEKDPTVSSRERENKVAMELGVGVLPGRDLEVDTAHGAVRHSVGQMTSVFAGLESLRLFGDPNLGMSFRIGYGYTEAKSRSPVALHLIPAEAMVVGHPWSASNATLRPFVKLGLAGTVWYQRGIEEDNSSGLSLSPALGAGVAWTPSWFERRDTSLLLDWRVRDLGRGDSWTQTSALMLGAQLGL